MGTGRGIFYIGLNNLPEIITTYTIHMHQMATVLAHVHLLTIHNAPTARHNTYICTTGTEAMQLDECTMCIVHCGLYTWYCLYTLKTLTNKKCWITSSLLHYLNFSYRQHLLSVCIFMIQVPTPLESAFRYRLNLSSVCLFMIQVQL